MNPSFLGLSSLCVLCVSALSFPSFLLSFSLLPPHFRYTIILENLSPHSSGGLHHHAHPEIRSLVRRSSRFLVFLPSPNHRSRPNPRQTQIHHRRQTQARRSRLRPHSPQALSPQGKGSRLLPGQ